MPIRHALAAALAILLFVGCATPKQVIREPMPVLWLAGAETRRTTRGISAEVQFPAGDYRASFRDEAGTYYAPAAQIFISGRPITGAYLFVDADSGRHALFMDGAIMVDWLDAQVPVAARP